MKKCRAKCRPAGLASAASLLLALAAAGLWVRSYWRADQWEFVRFTDGPVWYGEVDEFEYYPVRAVRVRSAAGRIACWRVWMTAPPTQTRERPGWWYAHAAEVERRGECPAPVRWHRVGLREWMRELPPSSPPPRGGFAWWSGGRAATADLPGESYAGASIPLWLPALAFAVLPALSFARARRAGRRLRQNRCLACGYDLRASPERCPECGALAPRR